MAPPHLGEGRVVTRGGNVYSGPRLDELMRSEGRAVELVERRDPTAATEPLTYQGVGQPMVAEWDAEQAIRWGYLANVFVYACIQAIATDLSALAFRAGADPEKPADFDTKAPLARLLGPPPFGPNKTTSSRRLWANAIAAWLATGRIGWELELAQRSNDIAAIWPLAVSRLLPIPSQGGARYFDSFRYGRAAAYRNLSAEQVFYAWNPSLEDWRQPESRLQAARLDISVAVMQDRYDHAFLRNDARPAAVIVHEQFAVKDERDAFRNQFLAEHRGPTNAGRPMFVEAEDPGEAGVAGTIDVKVLGLNQRDAMFIERYESKVRGICVGLGVPLSRLMDASKRTFSNADRETLNYWQNTVLPLALDLADEVNMQLAPRLGDKVGWFDLSKVRALQPPSKFAPVSITEAFKARLVTKNEARREIGQPEIDGGDEFAPEPVLPALPPPLAAAAEAPHELRSGAGLHSHYHRHSDGTTHNHVHAHANFVDLDHGNFGDAPHEHGHRSAEGHRDANTAGVMVALFPDPTTAAALAIDGGEPIELLHLTLAFLGQAADLGDRDTVIQAVAGFAAAAPPVEGEVSGTGTFSAGEETVVVALVDAPTLPEWRQRLIAALAAAGITVDTTHGFTPHITIAYTDTEGIEAPAGLALRFDAITLAWGQDRVEFTLRGERARPARVARVRRPRPRPQRHPEPAPLTAEELARAAGQRRARTWRAADAQVRTLEGAWKRGMRSLFRRQQAHVLSRLTGKRGAKAIGTGTRVNPPDASSIFDPTSWAAETADAVTGLYESVVAVGAGRVAGAFDFAFDIEAPYAQDFITARANQLAGYVTDTTYAAIQEALAEGVAEGLSIDELADLVRGVFADASDMRAEMIARTEVISAYNGSAALVAGELPSDVVGGMEWIATTDDRTRLDHADADGQVVAVGESFDVGGESLAYPGDPDGSEDNVINCRCTVGLMTPEEMDGGRSALDVETALARLDAALSAA